MTKDIKQLLQERRNAVTSLRIVMKSMTTENGITTFPKGIPLGRGPQAIFLLEYIDLLEKIVQKQAETLKEIETCDYNFKPGYSAELWAMNCRDEVIKMLEEKDMLQKQENDDR